mmetsp:Transcript_19756/g.64222  ORF Transcript_19756/g.64222 Transcript_19756/m.64222 type:complete len:186 (-) Transcript_19756:1445-2002(-)
MHVCVSLYCSILSSLSLSFIYGRFVELAMDGFYDHQELSRADGFVVQSGEKPCELPPIPLEIRVLGDHGPAVYSSVLDETRLGRGASPALPFAATGTLAMARNELEADSGRSAFFLRQRPRRSLRRLWLRHGKRRRARGPPRGRHDRTRAHHLRSFGPRETFPRMISIRSFASNPLPSQLTSVAI